MKILKNHNLKKFYKIKITPNFFINIWFFPVALCSVFGGYWKFFFTGFFVALLHELSHVFCAIGLKIPISDITIFPFGINARLKTDYIKNSGKEFFIAFSGPFLNLILFWCSIFLSKYITNKYLQFFADINLAICMINLIPTLPLDGGRMLKSIISAKYGIIPAYNFLNKLSKICICTMAVFSAIILLFGKFNFSLILILSFLLSNLSHEEALVSHIAFKEIIKNHRKLEDSQTLPARVFCVSENAMASNIIRHLGCDYFLIVHICQENSKIVKTLTETEILSALTTYGTRLKYKDI